MRLAAINVAELLLSFMKEQSIDTGSPRVAPSHFHGILLAALGVLAFSFSFPGTVWALDGFGPWSVAGVRGVIAAVLAAVGLLLMRGPLPSPQDWPALAVVAIGCAIGFPLLTTLALQTSSTAHSAVVIGALPMATASISAWRTGKRHSPMFWTGAGLGALTVIIFALTQNHGRPSIADLYLFGALLLCAAGYAEGGRLSSHMPGWRVIAWGVLLATPINLTVAAWALSHEPLDLSPTAIGGMLYISCISQFLGFVVWYRGMGLIGVARASQLQLAQPLLTLAWAVLLMGESLPATIPLAAAAVLTCIVITQRAKT